MAEIFHTHERLNRETRTPRMLRTLGGSLVAHALFLAAVVYVPMVRDTFNLASTLSGFRVVEEDYTKTAVGERATLINLADTKMYYPPGYFSQTALPSPDAPQLLAEFRPQPTPRPIRVRPTPQPTPTPEASPSPEATDAETAAKNEADKNGVAGASPTPATATPQTAEEAERIAKEAGAEKFPTINTKPFTDLLKQGKEMREAKEIDLSVTLEMEVEADREDDGRLSNINVTGAAASNPKLYQLAKDFVAAIGDSKLLAALKGTKHLKMHVKLDEKEVAVRVLTEMASESEATTMASGYNGLLFLGALSKKGKDEEVLFKSVQIAAESNQIVLTFNMPRAKASDLLSKLIKKNETVPPPPG
ncbi:MAG TPA: hypothetical protein VGO96_12125 [Pyrinomonadaceae bacterium]|jgi:hypothetical protein|nr:hypothetical protein [Pyrinomonadaceae bacterium]